MIFRLKNCKIKKERKRKKKLMINLPTIKKVKCCFLLFSKWKKILHQPKPNLWEKTSKNRVKCLCAKVKNKVICIDPFTCGLWCWDIWPMLRVPKKRTVINIAKPFKNHVTLIFMTEPKVPSVYQSVQLSKETQNNSKNE